MAEPVVFFLAGNQKHCDAFRKSLESLPEYLPCQIKDEGSSCVLDIGYQGVIFAQFNFSFIKHHETVKGHTKIAKTSWVLYFGKPYRWAQKKVSSDMDKIMGCCVPILFCEARACLELFDFFDYKDNEYIAVETNWSGKDFVKSLIDKRMLEGGRVKYERSIAMIGNDKDLQNLKEDIENCPEEDCEKYLPYNENACCFTEFGNYPFGNPGNFKDLVEIEGINYVVYFNSVLRVGCDQVKKNVSKVIGVNVPVLYCEKNDNRYSLFLFSDYEIIDIVTNLSAGDLFTYLECGNLLCNQTGGEA